MVKGISKQEKVSVRLSGNWCLVQARNLCVAMELVTAVLGDHGQRPKQDYIVVTSISELGGGSQPRFWATPEIVEFCRQWRLPTNQYWLFASTQSASTYFEIFDMIGEEGTASEVTESMNKIADVAVPRENPATFTSPATFIF